MNNVLAGILAPLVVALIYYAARGFRMPLRGLIMAPLCMLLCGLWAIVPDMPRLAGQERLYIQLLNDARCDAFFWHHSLDLVEGDRWWAMDAVAVALCVGLVLVALRELRLVEKGSGRTA